MDRSRARRIAGAVVLAALALAPTAWADRWEGIRREIIDPVNTALHRHLPKAIQERNLDAILEFYATDTGTGLTWERTSAVYPEKEEDTLRWVSPGAAESIRSRYRRLLDLCATVEKAEVRIHRVHWTEESEKGIPAEARFLVRGARSDGALVQVDQRVRWTIVAWDGQWRITSEEVTAREAVSRRDPGYALATEAAGIASVHTNSSSPPFRLIGNTAASSGSAVADVDGDGCEDVFLAGSPEIALYRNKCDGTFEDSTEPAGLPRRFPTSATGTVFFDYDNDGRSDLYVTAISGGDRLYRNLGGGRFADVTAKARIPRTTTWGSMPIVADYDRDGFLDVYVVRMGDHEKTAPRPNYEADNGIPNTLFRNNGDGTFSDVTDDAGVGDTGWGLAGAWGDYDGDGWPDLYVGNEFGFNTLYHNDGDGTFTDVTAGSGTSDRAAAMGVVWGDYDNDGDLDIFVSNMYANSRWALFHPDFPVPIPWYYRAIGFFTSEVKQRSDQIVHELTRGNTLLRNDGDGTFTDASDDTGIRDGQWGWAAEFLDYDNDGWVDVFNVNGFITGELPDDV